MKTTLEKVGRRLYFRDAPFAANDRISNLGATFDWDVRCWWVGSAKLIAATALVEAINGGATDASARAAEDVGLSDDTPAGIVADAVHEPGNERKADELRGRAKEDPAKVRLTGKGKYKGRSYYMGSRTRDGSRVRLLTLPDANGDFLDFWADATAVEVEKTYGTRTVGYGRWAREESMTLGSIASFIARQRRDEKDGVPQCADCRKRNHDLIRDLEDGLMKCRSCCDMPE